MSFLNAELGNGSWPHWLSVTPKGCSIYNPNC
jgi:hypothetical protein